MNDYYFNVYNDYILKANRYHVSSLVPIYKNFMKNKEFLHFVCKKLPDFHRLYHKEIKSGEPYYKDCCSTESLIRLWFIQLQSRYEKRRHRLHSHLQ